MTNEPATRDETSALPLVVAAESGDEARLAPGRRARVRLAEGRLVVEALPEGFRFASDFDDGLVPTGWTSVPERAIVTLTRSDEPKIESL